MWFTSHCASARLVLFSFTNRKHDDVAFNDRPAALLLPLRDASLCIHGRSLEQALSARLASDENMARAGCRAGGYRVSNAISATPTFDEAHYKALITSALPGRLRSGRAPDHLFPACHGLK